MIIPFVFPTYNSQNPNYAMTNAVLSYYHFDNGLKLNVMIAKQGYKSSMEDFIKHRKLELDNPIIHEAFNMDSIVEGVNSRENVSYSQMDKVLTLIDEYNLNGYVMIGTPIESNLAITFGTHPKLDLKVLNKLKNVNSYEDFTALEDGQKLTDHDYEVMEMFAMIYASQALEDYTSEFHLGEEDAYYDEIVELAKKY